MSERVIKAVHESGPGVKMFMDVGGVGTYPVARLVGDTGPGVEVGFFVSESFPGVELVNVVAGHEFLPGRAAEHHRQQQAQRFDQAVRAAADDLTPEQLDVLVALSAAFDAVVADAADVQAARRVGELVRAALQRSWPPAFLEDLLRQGVYGMHVLVTRHEEYAEALPTIRAMFSVVLERRWLDGGPTGQFDSGAARECSRLLGLCEQRLRPPEPPAPPAPPAAEPKKRGLFGRRR